MTPSAARRRVGAAGALAVCASLLRPRLQWLGTSHEERTATYPGDDLIPGGRRYGAMATTIAAPPEWVWPWLVQMGYDRRLLQPRSPRQHVGLLLRPTVDGHARLVVTGKARGKPHALIAVANWLFWDPAHWVMQLKQFAGLRRRAESVPNGAAAAPAREDAGASGAGVSDERAPDSAAVPA
jgi:hypothetical protein